MKPFLNYGWQPQIMAVEGAAEVDPRRAGSRLYDVVADPGETRDIADGADVARGVRQALRDYPVPSPEAARAPDALERRRRGRRWRASAT